jgi:hypothetical protein
MAADELFIDALKGLRNGDFSRLEPLFIGGGKAKITQWCEEGRFEKHPAELDEALSCASFLGHTAVVEYLLKRGVDPSGGNATGSNALHWAANRGKLEATRTLLRWKAPLESKNRFGGTVLSATVWSYFNEPRRDHLRIIEELLNAGARVNAVEYPTGNAELDELMRSYGAGSTAE